MGSVRATGPNEVDTIIGATQDWAESKSKRKAHMRSVMSLAVQAPCKKVKDTDNWAVTFFDDEAELLQDTGNDPIVVKLS